MLFEQIHFVFLFTGPAITISKIKDPNIAKKTYVLLSFIRNFPYPNKEIYKNSNIIFNISFYLNY